MKRQMNWLLVGVLLASFLAGCGPAPTPQVIEKEVLVTVEKEVPVTVEVEKEVVVEKPVVQTVEVVKEVPGVTAGETVYEVYPPYGVPTIEILKPVPRLDTLEGKTICGIPGAFHFQETWPVMVELLQKRYPTAKFIGPEVIPTLFTASGAPNLDGLAEEIKKWSCDAIIAGNGC